MATPDSEISGFPTATTWDAGDWFVHYDISETNPLSTTKKISGENLFGKTSGITTSINYGIGEQSGYQMYFYTAATNINVGLFRADGANMLFGATSIAARFGSVNAYPSRINTNNTSRLEINATTGVITTAPTYGHDMVGETIRAVQVNDSGELGYTSSSMRGKTNILPVSDTTWIHQLAPKEYERPGYPGQIEVGLIAEEVDLIPGIPHNLVTYETYIVDGENLLPITNNDFEDPLEVKRVLVKNAIINKTVWKIKSRYTSLTKEEAEAGHDVGDIKEKEQFEVEVKKVPETIEYTRLIAPMLAELQKLRAELNSAALRIDVLENK